MQLLRATHNQWPNSGTGPAAPMPIPHGQSTWLVNLQRTIGNHAVRRLLASRNAQAKLVIGQPDDVYEQEADRVAERVMRTLEPSIVMDEPGRGRISPRTPPLHCDASSDRRAQRQRISVSDPGEMSLPDDFLSPLGAGQPLAEPVRAHMEPRFGTDFGAVRIHTDARASKLAGAVNARAFTVGTDIAFAAGQYVPASEAGQRLLAHELTHTLQQGGGRLAGGTHPGQGPIVRQIGRSARLQRARFNVGKLSIDVDYSGLTTIAAGDFVSEIETRFVAWTGGDAATIHGDVVALSGAQRRWVLFALDLLTDNTSGAHGALNRAEAARRLIAHAPAATTQPLQAGYGFENEALRISGWFVIALAAPLTAPSAAALTTITGLYNPPSAAPGGKLDIAALQAQILPALTKRLKKADPANWTKVGTQPLATLQTIANAIQQEARTVFSPYADTAMGNVYAENWAYATALQSTLTTALTPDRRIGYLLNRAEIVGRENRPKGSIFSNVNFDSSRPADRAALLSVVTPMASDPVIQPIVDRLIQHTGRARPTARKVWVSTEFEVGPQTECSARWSTIDTLCHELVHIMVHPDFPARATTIGFGQILREGFTEVLGVQLHRAIVTRAAGDAAFKTQLEAGIVGPACPAPAPATIGYGEAGSSAEKIRVLVGDDNFRAAYFLGAVHLVGLT